MENGFSWLYLLIIGLFFGGLSFEIPTANAGSRFVRTDDHVRGELVVKIRDAKSGKGVETSRAAMANLISSLQRKLGEKSVLDIRSFITDKAMHVIRVARDQDLSSAIATLKTNANVEIAEPNVIFRAFDDGVPNDPDFVKTWGLKNTGQTDAAGQVGKVGSDINVLPLWQEGLRGSRKVLVAVIDTGIDWSHPDLTANIYTNPGEAGENSANGKDDDGNEFIDDVHGWNFVDKTNNSKDDHNHGSHCAGTIGAEGNNGIGVAGVNWEVSLLPVKFLDAEGGGSLQGAIESINYARMMKVNIMSNSWGGGSFTESLKMAIEATRDAGIVFVAAAGNDSSNNDKKPSYPASYDVENIISVAATDNQDKIAKFSNYGVKSVHVAAPGVKVYSTVKDGKYATYSGTSMATPHVAGVAALMLSGNSALSYADIKNLLIKTSDPVPGLEKKVVAKGRVNAFNAYHEIVPPPLTPPTGPDESQWKDVVQVVESAHPYSSKQDLMFKISQPGAKFIRVHFEQIGTENNYDHVIVQTPTGEELDRYTGELTNVMSPYASGDTVIINLKTDDSVENFGFKIDRIQVVY